MLAISMGLYGLLAPQFMLVFFALFIYLGAAQESVAALGRSLTHGIPIRAAMITEFHTLEHHNTIRDAANLLLSTSQQDFPVMHGDQVVGLLGRNLLIRAMAAEGPDAYVAGVMDRDFLALEPNADLAEILPLMARAGRCALVMENGRCWACSPPTICPSSCCCAASGWNRSFNRSQSLRTASAPRCTTHIPASTTVIASAA